MGITYFATVAADLVILTINTGEIATAEKNITNTICTTDNRFFAMMNADGTDIEAGITSAHAYFATQSVGVTVARTNVAGSQWLEQEI